MFLYLAIAFTFLVKSSPVYFLSILAATVLAATAPVPWFFIIGGIITAVLAGLVIYAIVKAAKKRKEMNKKENSVYDGR